MADIRFVAGYPSQPEGPIYSFTTRRFQLWPPRIILETAYRQFRDGRWFELER